jgi:hypothetical protein
MIKINMLRPKAVFSYDGHAIVRNQYDFWKALVEDDSPPHGEWKPGTLKLKYIPSPPKPPDVEGFEWRLIHEIINTYRINNE